MGVIFPTISQRKIDSSLLDIRTKDVRRLIGLFPFIFALFFILEQVIIKTPIDFHIYKLGNSIGVFSVLSSIFIQNFFVEFHTNTRKIGNGYVTVLKSATLPHDELINSQPLIVIATSI